VIVSEIDLRFIRSRLQGGVADYLRRCDVKEVPARASQFAEMAERMMHRSPTTPLEEVLRTYSWSDSSKVIDVVIDNDKTLRKAGLLEDAFVDAWCMAKNGIPNWDITFTHAFFSTLCPERLRAAGDPLPEGSCFEVFRGVAGYGTARRVRGYSWTGDLTIARHFARLRAERYRLPGPAVYRARIRREHVFAYIDESGRNEQEFLLWPRGLAELEEIKE